MNKNELNQEKGWLSGGSSEKLRFLTSSHNCHILSTLCLYLQQRGIKATIDKQLNFVDSDCELEVLFVGVKQSKDTRTKWFEFWGHPIYTIKQEDL